MIGSDEWFAKAVYRALCTCLFVDPDTEQGAALVVPASAYQGPEPPPRPPRTQNIVYFTVQSEDVAAERYQQFSDSPFTIHTFLTYRLLVICYGPLSERYAHLIRDRIFLDGYGFPRYILRQSGIYPIPQPAQPVLLDELEDSLIRRRADLTVSIRVRDDLGVSVPTVSVAPDVVVHTSI